MPLNFNGKALYFSNHAPNIAPPQIEVVRTKFFGVQGESEIVGKPGGRTIQYYGWIFDANALKTAAAVVAYLESLDQLVGVNSILVETGNINRTFRDCTLQGFECQGVCGGSILKDEAGTLGGGFWTDGIFTWYQNTVK